MNPSNSSLIAPCGMNCGVCIAHLRNTNTCPGCRFSDAHKSKTRVNCKIKTCAVFQNSKVKFCFKCNKFPCDVLKHLDKRYRTKYNMSMIENLENIKKIGLYQFLQNEQIRWGCVKCGGTICVHKGVCLNCGKKKVIPT